MPTKSVAKEWFNRNAKPLLKKMRKEVENLAKVRDRLRDIHSDLESLIEESEYAQIDLGDGLDTIERAIDKLSERV